MDRCVACGAELGVGRFCLNCGHPIGAPAPVPAAPAAPEPAPDPDPAPVDEAPVALPVQAADPTAMTPLAPSGPPAESGFATVPVAAPDDTQLAGPEPPAPVVRAPAASAWDPSLDLLPYEEVDELEVDDPVPGRAWIAWVVGAVALLALVFLLLRVFATDDDAVVTDQGDQGAASQPVVPADETSEAGTAAPKVPRGVGKRLDLAVTASFQVPGTAPPTTDLDGTLVGYAAGQMADGKPATAWRIAGDATGQQVVVTLAEPGVVNRVGLVNGYAKQVAGVDWYPNNRRILAVTWGFDDGTQVEQTFAERPAMQRLKVPAVTTSTVTITITSVTPPGSGTLGRDYTAISEVAVIGRRAR